MPASADAKAPPRWQLVDKTGRLEWHDHRMHWMGKGLPPQIEDQGRRTKVFDYRIPIEVGSQRGAITGTLVWQPESSSVPAGAFVGLGLVAVVGVCAVVVVRRRRRPSAPAAEAW